MIDVLRASTTLVTMLAHGAPAVTLAPDTRAALAWGQDDSRAVLCGEVNGLPPPGFHLGNSPGEYVNANLSDRPLVFSTSNGTRALAAVRRAPVVLVGCLANATAVVERALAEARAGGWDVAFVCAGRALGGAFGLDDAYCAGALLSRVEAEGCLTADAPPDADFDPPGDEPYNPNCYLDESALAALRLYRGYGPDALPAFRDSGNGRGLIRLGLGADLAFCARTDWTDVVPRLDVADTGLRVVASD